MPHKNIGRLTPIKKNVIDKRSNTPIERTYYIDPNKQKLKGREPGKGELEAPEKAKQSPEPEKITQPEKSAQDTALKPKAKNTGIDLNKIKSFDDFGREGIDPAAARQFFCNI